MAAKEYDELTFKERLIRTLHNDLSFRCKVKDLKLNEFHTCPECRHRANQILLFLRYELSKIPINE